MASKFTSWIGTILVILGLSSIQSCSREPGQCPLCNREVHAGMEVKVAHNHIPMQTCCMACALTFQKQTKDVEITAVTDFISGTSTDAKNAFYVLGSDVSPCIQDPKVQKVLREQHSALHSCYDRCEPGILAFQSRQEAEKFIQQHGGFIRSFQQLAGYIAVKGKAHHD